MSATRTLEISSKDIQIKHLIGFFAVLGCFWVVSAALWMNFGYHDTFKQLQPFRNSVLDYVSLYAFTHFADGLVLPGIFFLLFWRKDPQFVLTAFIAILLTGFVTQFGKLVLFSDWVRPPVHFLNDPTVDIFHPSPPKSRSFPSGHSTSAACGGLFFAYMWGKRHWLLSIAIGVFTVFVGLTRVIIGVHFPGDVFIGSMIGSIGGFLLLKYLYPILIRRLGILHKQQTARAALIVSIVSVMVIIGQLIHLYSEY